MSTASVVTQGVTAQVSLRALDRSINELNAARRRFSLLHDLCHHILAEPGANESGMSAVFDNLLILTRPEHDHLADLSAALSDGVLQPDATLPALSAERQPAPVCRPGILACSQALPQVRRSASTRGLPGSSPPTRTL